MICGQPTYTEIFREANKEQLLKDWLAKDENLELLCPKEFSLWHQVEDALNKRQTSLNLDQLLINCLHEWDYLKQSYGEYFPPFARVIPFYNRHYLSEQMRLYPKRILEIKELCLKVFHTDEEVARMLQPQRDRLDAMKKILNSPIAGKWVPKTELNTLGLTEGLLFSAMEELRYYDLINETASEICISSIDDLGLKEPPKSETICPNPNANTASISSNKVIN
jgi:hypothetical protein